MTKFLIYIFSVVNNMLIYINVGCLVCVNRVTGHPPYGLFPVAGAPEADSSSTQLDAPHAGRNQKPHPIQREERGRWGPQSSRQPQGKSQRSVSKAWIFPSVSCFLLQTHGQALQISIRNGSNRCSFQEASWAGDVRYAWYEWESAVHPIWWISQNTRTQSHFHDAQDSIYTSHLMCNCRRGYFRDQFLIV